MRELHERKKYDEKPGKAAAREIQRRPHEAQA